MAERTEPSEKTVAVKDPQHYIDQGGGKRKVDPIQNIVPDQLAIKEYWTELCAMPTAKVSQETQEDNQPF